MSDIFISYAREDREIAGRLAGALEAAGWSVWWDSKLRAGTSTWACLGRACIDQPGNQPIVRRPA